MIKKIETPFGIQLLEILKNSPIAELVKPNEMLNGHICRSKVEMTLIIDGREYVKVGENEKNYLYQEMR